MKKKLLFLAIIFLTAIKGFSQAEAFPAPDINQCGWEVFDLTVQTPIILGSDQDPEIFTVTYYTTQADAENDVNPIANPNAFVSPQQQMIFAKVTNSDNGDSDITVFHISWVSGVFVPELSDVVSCPFYTLYPLDFGNYYLSPGGVDLLPFGTNITVTTLIYIYAENDNGCTGESNFLVTVVPGPITNQPTPLYVCDDNGDGTTTFNLNAILPQLVEEESTTVVTFHETQLDAETNVNAIPNPENFLAVTTEQTVYVRGQNSITDCFWVVPIQLIITECNDNSVSGFVSFNTDDDCDTFEAAASGIPVYYTHNNDVFIAYTNVDGHYSFENLPDGEGTIYIPGTTSSTVSPENHTVTMPGNEEALNFCITPGAVVNDVAVTLIAVSQARPGFPASYVLVYQNLGTSTQSGDILLAFDESKISYVNAEPAMVQSGNTLTYSYTNLMPYQTKAAVVNFTVMPDVTLIGAVLNFEAYITPLIEDVNTGNNSSLMSQVIVGSYDPNDIAVREGKEILEDQTDDYLNYTVRFQNSGTANAEFVRVVVALDENLDWSTFEAISASDAFTVSRIGNEVTFMFNDIDLPYESADEPGSHGHIIYRIKPKAEVTIGDIMYAQADIFFDFNPAITTEEIETKVVALVGINDNVINNFTIYPNPATANVNLILSNTTATGFDVTVTDVLGKTVLNNSFNGTEANLNIANLTSGVYFINITAEGKQATKKLVIK